jgi:hypothetical protein
VTRFPFSAAAVLGMGASSPIGYGVAQIQLAMAGGLRNFQEGSLIAGNSEPVRTSRLPDVDEAAPRAERIAVLTRSAMGDLLENVKVHLPGRIPVYVGVANDAPASDLAAIRRVLVDGSQGLVDPDATTFFGYREGRIAFLSAMAQAIRSFDSGAVELALVVAADTRCTWDAMHSLMQERRLLTEQDDGTIPGEAAVVVLVASLRSSLATEHARFLVADPAFADDDFETIRQSPQVTQGLSRAFRMLREHPVSGAVRPAAVIAFESGELFFTRAFATGYLRNAELMPEPLQHELIATNLGDTGAAAAGMALVRADWLMRRLEGREDRRVLIYGHADEGKCAAAMAIRPEQRMT